MVVHIQVTSPLGAHVAGHVGDRDLHVAVPEVDPEHRLRGVAEHELNRGPASTRIGLDGVHLLDHRPPLQLRDQGVDSCPRQAGDPCDLGLAQPPTLTQHTNHTLAVAIAEPRERPISLLRHRAQWQSWAGRRVCQETEQIWLLTRSVS